MQLFFYATILFSCATFAMENAGFTELSISSDPRNFFVDEQGLAIPGDEYARPYCPDTFEKAMKILRSQNEDFRKKLFSNCVYSACNDELPDLARFLAFKKMDMQFTDEIMEKMVDSINCMRTLHDCGYSLANAVDSKGETLLFKTNNPEVFTFLVACGVDVNKCDARGRSLFARTVYERRSDYWLDVKKITQLLEAGASGIIDQSKGTGIWHELNPHEIVLTMTQRTENGNTPDYFSLANKFPQLRATRFDNKGNSIFCSIAQNGNNANIAGGWEYVCSVLSLYHDHMNQANKAGITPLQILQEKRQAGTLDCAQQALYSLLENPQLREECAQKALVKLYGPEKVREILLRACCARSGFSSIYELVNACKAGSKINPNMNSEGCLLHQ